MSDQQNTDQPEQIQHAPEPQIHAADAVDEARKKSLEIGIRKPTIFICARTSI